MPLDDEVQSDIVEVRHREQMTLGGQNEAPTAAWTGTADEFLDGGPDAATAALATLRSSLSFLLSPLNNSRQNWKEWLQSRALAGELVEAVVQLSQGYETADETPGDLRNLVVELGVTLCSLDNKFGVGILGRFERDESGAALVDSSGDSSSTFPILNWSTSLRRGLRAELDELALQLGGPWLIFASSHALATIADRDPGAYLGDINALTDLIDHINFSAGIDENQIQILRAFFRT